MALILLLIIASLYVNFKIVRDPVFLVKTERISVIYDGCRTDHI